MKTKYEKIGITFADKNWIPYKNRWGHWVWQDPADKSPHDMSWPGIKPPTKDAVPVWHKDGWYWKIDE